MAITSTRALRPLKAVVRRPAKLPVGPARHPVVVIAGRGPGYQVDPKQVLERDGYVTLSCPDLKRAPRLSALASVVLLYAERMRMAEIVEALQGCEAQSIVLCGPQFSISDRVDLLDNGADDVVVLPIGERELAARVRARLRRAKTARAADPISLGNGRVLDVTNCVIHANGQAQRLTSMELRLLQCLALELGRPLPLSEVAASLWGREYPLSAARQGVRALVYRLRRKLEANPAEPQLLRAVRGRGWILGPSPQPLPAPRSSRS